MFGIGDDSIFTSFEEQEQSHPSPPKVIGDNRSIYLSRELDVPKNWEAPILCNFGSAVEGDVEHTEDVQPNVYRSHEVILEVPWSYEIDIWNVGCMIWDLFEGGNLFTGQDPELHTYRSRTHLAEMIALLGKPLRPLLDSGALSHKFFTDSGDFRAEIPTPKSVPLEERETSIEDPQEREDFLAMVRKMIQWEPSKRARARMLCEDKWLQRYLQ